MRTYPKHLKPTKRNQRKMEKAIEAAKKAKQKEAALIEKYERIAAKQREKANQEWERAFKNMKPAQPTVQAPVQKPAQPAKPVVPTVQPPVQKPAQAPAQKPVAAPPAPVIEWEDDEPEKRRGGVFFTVAGIIFLLIAIGMTLWQFGFLDKFLQKPVPDQPAASAVETSVEDV